MQKFALIGEHLGHSFSRQIHEKFGNYQYDYLEVEPDQLADTIRSDEYAGFNVTIPYKKKVMSLCDELSDRAIRIGSVNTIVRKGCRLYGENTDYYGFTYMLKRNKIDVAGKKCLVLGSGGASVMVQTALADLGASEIVVISRTGVNNYENLNLHVDAEVIVNATPVGMYPNNWQSPVHIEQFPELTGVVDLIYNPNNTKLVLDAKSRGICACGGLSMLVAQAKQSSEIFQNKEIPDDEISDVIYELRSETLNTVLIGMPGAGKTYLGRKIAEKGGRTFIDLDEMIEQKEGRPIPKIFEEDGEDYFRNVETECLREACKRTGVVIACGGGIVRRKVNYSIMKQNGRVIWVKRDLDKLEREGRPISLSKPPEEIYEERHEAYEEWSDFFIDNNQDFE